MLYSEMSNYN